MRYLLEVNALLALGFLEQHLHNRMTNWINSVIDVLLRPSNWPQLHRYRSTTPSHASKTCHAGRAERDYQPAYSPTLITTLPKWDPLSMYS